MRRKRGTWAFAVADREGNVIAITQSFGHMFGSNVMVGDTGLWMMDGIRVLMGGADPRRDGYAIGW